MAWPMGKRSTISSKKGERAKMRIFEGGEKWPWLHLHMHREKGGGFPRGDNGMGKSGLEPQARRMSVCVCVRERDIHSKLSIKA